MSECATLNCPANGRVGTCYYFDYLGRLRCFCTQHAEELRGVRERITALLAQIEALGHVLAVAKVIIDPVGLKLAYELRTTLCEQGALLVQLIARERELTGAAEVAKP